MESIDEGKMKAQERKMSAQEVKECAYLIIGKLLKVFASSVGISHYKYYQIIAPCLETETTPSITPATVKRYTNRGIPQNLSFSRLSAAIEQAYQSYVNAPERTNKEKEIAEKGHKAFYPILLDEIVLPSGECKPPLLKILYHIAEFADECKPFLEKDFQMWLTINAFLNGSLFTDGEVPSQEDLNWLRESFRRFPPKGIELLNKTEERQPAS